MAPGRRQIDSSQGDLHNLKNLTVEVPLGRFVCVTGVSGSGKSTLITEILGPAVAAKLKGATAQALVSKDRDEEDERRRARQPDGRGLGRFGPVVVRWISRSSGGRLDPTRQSILGAFDDIRAFFAAHRCRTAAGLGPSAFSFNSAQGQCERCRGAGFEKIEMQFLSDIFIRCPECNGRRYRPHILEITVHSAARKWSIADLLEAPVDEAIDFLAGFPESRPAASAARSLKVLQEAGLGYLRAGPADQHAFGRRKPAAETCQSFGASPGARRRADIIHLR